MGRRRTFLIGTVVAIVLAGLPIAGGTATPCGGCCPEMAACCEMAPVPPATPARQDWQALTPQPAARQTAQGAVPAVSFHSVPYPPVGHRYVPPLRSVVLRI